MSDLRIQKPVIFISHATTDNPIVDILKFQIEQVFANGVEVFASSVPGVIKPGSVWLNEIKNNLEIAKVVLVIVTPVSINRPWIWFEVGASWSKMEIGKGRIYPLCVPEIDFDDLPAPLNSLQALSLGKAKDIQLLFRELCDQFGFGDIKRFKGSTLSSRLPKYSDLKINQNDLKSGTIYSGPYEGYLDQELEEILIDKYLHPQYSSFRGVWSIGMLPDDFLPTPVVKPRISIFDGLLIHYHELDETLKLPPGTSKRLLKKVASQFGLVPMPDKDFDNSVRFTYDGTLDKHRIE